MRMLEGREVEELRRRVVEWYELHGDKSIPWRRDRGGWPALIAALLVRRTSTKQAVRAYSEITRRFPTPGSLLSVSISEIREILRPLGLYNKRSRELVEIARTIAREHRGRVPCSRRELLKLPGIGEYGASIVLLVACRIPEPLLDTNVMRVLGRLLGIEARVQRPYSNSRLTAMARSLVPSQPDEALKFNLGLLDIARMLCKPRTPRCPGCPLRGLCCYHSSGRA